MLKIFQQERTRQRKSKKIFLKLQEFKVQDENDSIMRFFKNFSLIAYDFGFGCFKSASFQASGFEGSDQHKQNQSASTPTEEFTTIISYDRVSFMEKVSLCSNYE
jgi:hypothetical protein